MQSAIGLAHKDLDTGDFHNGLWTCFRGNKEHNRLKYNGKSDFLGFPYQHLCLRIFRGRRGIRAHTGEGQSVPGRTTARLTRYGRSGRPRSQSALRIVPRRWGSLHTRKSQPGSMAGTKCRPDPSRWRKREGADTPGRPLPSVHRAPSSPWPLPSAASMASPSPSPASRRWKPQIAFMKRCYRIG